MAESSVVRITNTGDHPFSDWFNGDRYTIGPHETVLLSFDAMCLWLGHPKANNFDVNNRVRVMEYERLRCKYGVDARALEMAKNGEPVNPDLLWNSMRPSLECTDVEGKPIVTVADDPEGTTLRPLEEEATEGNQMALIMSKLQQQEREAAILRSELAQLRRTRSALDDAVPTSEDQAPPNPTRSDIIGTVEANPLDPDHPEAPKTSPRAPARTEVGEDTPTRVRVSGG